MTPEPRARRAPRKRAVGAVLATVLLLVGLVTITTQTASAAPQNVTAGGLDWGVKQSFRNYLAGPISEGGTITLAGGATQNPDGTFHFPAATSSTFDAASGTPTASFSGSVKFLAHNGLLDITVNNIRIVRSGATGSIVADVVSREFQGTNPPSAPPFATYTGVVLADLTAGTYATTATSAGWSGATSKMSTTGAPAFGNFYPAGTDLDPVTYSLTLQSTPPAPGPATGALVWKVSPYVSTSSSLTLAPASAAGAPAVRGSDAWGFPSTNVAYNPATKATQLDLGGSIILGNVNQGGYRVVLASPSINVTADGAGTLSADVSYCASTALCTTPGLSTPVRAVVANFAVADADVTDTGSNVSWTATPVYAPQANPVLPGFGQFPSTFLDILPTSLQGHFKDTASTATPPVASSTNVNKPPAPLVVNFAYTPVTPEPVGAVQNITTEVLANGGLTISVANNSVALPTPLPNGNATALVASGAINPVTVTDLRLTNPGWNAKGQVTDFSGTGGTISGSGLGWTPSVTSSSTGQTVTPGSAVAAGVGNGLKDASTLGSALAGAGRGTAVLGAGLNLTVPTSTAPGVYTATLTLTVI